MSVIAIVGLGLIGGSFAKALRACAPGDRIVGIEPSASTRALVEADQVVDLLLDAPASLDDCDIVVICTPLAATIALLPTLSLAMRDGALLTDVAGVKLPVIEAARGAVRKGVLFASTHPMFGGAEGGYAASDGTRWKGGAVALVTDDADPSALDRVEALHVSLGAQVVRCTAEAHDRAVAVVSHLPYVLACALADEGRDASELAHRLAGRGFADMTRLAGFSGAVQGEVARRNVFLPAAIDSLIERLRARR